MPNNRRSTSATTSINGEKTALDSYDWRDYLRQNPSVKGVPPWSFEHVPLSKEWNFIGVKGYKIEVALTRDELPKYCEARDENSVYWIANANKFCGFMARIVYDGAEHIPKQTREQLSTRWVNFVTDAKRVGFTTMHSLSIMPPKCMETDKLENFDWRDYIFKKLVQKQTIPTVVTNDGVLVANYKSEYVINQCVEVLDKTNISRMRVAYVTRIVGGRIHVRYWDTKQEGDDFVCHEKSPAIVPSGWCRTVGHEINAPPGYSGPILKDATLQLLANYDNMPIVNIQEGMRLEAVDPLHPSIISAASVKKVLKHGYIMITIDGTVSANDKRKPAVFCCHVTSPLIFACGFCEKRELKLLPPKDYKGDPANFTWSNYSKHVKYEELPIAGLRRDDTMNHGIRFGMKLEAVDITEPELVVPATVAQVSGRLLKITQDGYGPEFDQWMDSKTTDLFPCGWCEVEKYPLQYPANQPAALASGAPSSSAQKKKGMV